jgi:hypothetical protein
LLSQLVSLATIYTFRYRVTACFVCARLLLYSRSSTLFTAHKIAQCANTHTLWSVPVLSVCAQCIPCCSSQCLYSNHTATCNLRASHSSKGWLYVRNTTSVTLLTCYVQSTDGTTVPHYKQNHGRKVLPVVPAVLFLKHAQQQFSTCMLFDARASVSEEVYTATE